MGARQSFLVVLSTLIIHRVAPQITHDDVVVAIYNMVDDKVIERFDRNVLNKGPQSLRREITKWVEVDPTTKKLITHNEKFKSIALLSHADGWPYCSGVSIVPPDGVKRGGPWVLTSAHCIWRPENSDPTKAHRWGPTLGTDIVRFGVHSGDLNNAYAEFRIAEAWVPAMYGRPGQTNDESTDYDFAILRLVTPDPSQPAQPKSTPVPLILPIQITRISINITFGFHHNH